MGCTGAPRYLGLDDSVRDTFSHLPAEFPTRCQTWSNEQVAVAGILLRSLHEGTRGSRLTAGHPVVCHHDPGPNNVVFRNDRPTAFIDFDTAAPGRASVTCYASGPCVRPFCVSLIGWRASGP
ncbi:aminoglycoside phosphotransferase family protein [Streptomyces sp. NBC_00257]|nr:MULTISPECIES: phosphotransferase [unclassified Streptomyces]MCX4398688.1 aminoglycoside phosphotransferase family protein [Streptomyces sp. NBC_01767]WSP52215.1 aminoglycoside phosphotransferase family protein [Streptomyces sp. NBC_01243]MCX4870984.1 aminoglycoside phosphotransferase family protein [Streptomyces sp. NBC_00906]MCX4901723.1 aminoglycoside phosphotransferase family protein [Streptomyces sp. NBC_00892]MCX5426966.1 aminoglycoside phosphotransferase family protein [Streptomyces s